MTTEQQWAVPVDDELATAGAPWMEGKVAVVAGGGLSGPEGGIGFAFAWLCFRSGAKVVVLDRDVAAGQRTVDAIREAGGEAENYEVDIIDDASCAAVVAQVMQRFGRIDVVGNSVGGGGVRGIFDTSLDDWKRAMDQNFTQAWLLMRNVEPHMTTGGSIVTISSGAVEGRGPGLPYTIAKTALEKLTQGAAGTLAPRGIRVNCVRVGMIWGAFAAHGMTQEQREIRRQNVAMQTEGNNWDIAAAAFFLSTRQARWISGQVLSVDGAGPAPRNIGQAGEKPAQARA